jgi:hypothetical protein
LSLTVVGDGGTAVVWGGAVVTHGGPTVTEHTLRRVTIGGKSVPSTCRTASFQTPSTRLAGCELTFAVPSGNQEIVIAP